jgi:hypothetical protein
MIRNNSKTGSKWNRNIRSGAGSGYNAVKSHKYFLRKIAYIVLFAWNIDKSCDIVLVV